MSWYGVRGIVYVYGSSLLQVSKQHIIGYICLRRACCDKINVQIPDLWMGSWAKKVFFFWHLSVSKKESYIILMKVTESILIGLTAAWSGEQRSQFATCQLASVVKASLCFSSFCFGRIQALIMNEMYIISYVSLMLFSECFHWWFAHQHARSALRSASRCRPWWSLFQSRDTVYLLTW